MQLKLLFICKVVDRFDVIVLNMMATDESVGTFIRMRKRPSTWYLRWLSRWSIKVSKVNPLQRRPTLCISSPHHQIHSSSTFAHSGHRSVDTHVPLCYHTVDTLEFRTPFIRIHLFYFPRQSVNRGEQKFAGFV